MSIAGYQNTILLSSDNSTTIQKTVFIDMILGDDTTGEIGNRNKPFASLDKAITDYIAAYPRTSTAIDHPFVRVCFLSGGNYPFNTLIPEQNILFDSGLNTVTIDFSANPNSRLNEDTESPFELRFEGLSISLKNHSDSFIYHINLKLSGNLKTIDSQRVGFGGETQAFIAAEEICISYDTIIGFGNVFRTLSEEKQNYFIGNINASGDLCLLHKSAGVITIDIDKGRSASKLLLFRSLLATTKAFIHLGDCNPNVYGNFIEGLASVYIHSKQGAVLNGKCTGNVTLSGEPLQVRGVLFQTGGNITIDNMHITTDTTLVTAIENTGKLTLINSVIELQRGGLINFISDQDFTNPILECIGYNTVIHATDNSNLITKFAPATPVNVKYLMRTENGLKTNGVLNTTITGTTDSIATITTETTRTY